MTEIYVIRIVLDTEEDVIRDIAIAPDSTLFNMHHAVVDAFKLNTGEMSSFFRSDEDWNQGEEISMMEFDPDSGTNALEKSTLKDVFQKKGSRMLFVYDYLKLWTFYLEVIDVQEAEPERQYPALVGILGKTPEQAPEKEMKVDPGDEDLLNDEFNPEELDDQDFNEEDWY